MKTTILATVARPSVLTDNKKLDFILSHGSLQKVMRVHNGIECECYLFEAKDKDLEIWVPSKGISDILGKIYLSVRYEY